MDHISILSVILISFPEAIILCLIGLMSIGRFYFLETKSGIIRVLLFAVITTVLIYFIRPNVKNEIESLLVYILLIFMLFVLLMRLKFYESIFATLFATLIFIVTEGICLTSISAITGIKMNNDMADIIRFLISLPERLIQVALIYLSYRHAIKIIDFEANSRKKGEYYIQLFVYMVSAGMLTFLTVTMGRLLLIDNNTLLSETSTLMLRINIYLTLFVTTVLTLSIRSIHELYKNKNTLSNNELKQSLEYISKLAELGDSENVKQALNSLKFHVDKQ